MENVPPTHKLDFIIKEGDLANVIVINPFKLAKGNEEQALAMWDKFAEYFRKQPGYVSVKLHRAISSGN